MALNMEVASYPNKTRHANGLLLNVSWNFEKERRNSMDLDLGGDLSSGRDSLLGGISVHCWRSEDGHWLFSDSTDAR